jgi:hypothetical protein
MRSLQSCVDRHSPPARERRANRESPPPWTKTHSQSALEDFCFYPAVYSRARRRGLGKTIARGFRLRSTHSPLPIPTSPNEC